MESLCKRCGRKCQTSDKTDPESVLVRRTAIPDGCCADCAITCFVKTGPLAQVTGGAWSAPGFEIGSALRLPHVQDQFFAVFRAAGCATVGTEINWERVIENWQEPIPAGWDWGGELYMTKKTKKRR